MQPKHRKPKSAKTAPADSPSSSLAVAEKPKRKSKATPEPKPPTLETMESLVKEVLPKVEKKPEPKSKAAPKAKLLPSDVGWQPSENGWQFDILMNPDVAKLSDRTLALGWDCHCLSLENVGQSYAESQRSALAELATIVLKKIVEIAKRTPPEKPVWTNIVGIRRPGAIVDKMTLRQDGAWRLKSDPPEAWEAVING